MAADGAANATIAAAVSVSPATVANWRTRFAEDGLVSFGASPGGGARRQALDPRRHAGEDRDAHRGIPAAGRDALEHKDNGRGAGDSKSAPSSGMAGVGPQTAPSRHVQGVQRPEVRGETRRCRGSVSEPAGERDRAVRRREVLGAGARPHAGVAADDQGPRADDDPRLQTQRHHHPVRGVERVDRHGDRTMPTATPPPGVSQIPAHHQPTGSAGLRST